MTCDSARQELAQKMSTSTFKNGRWAHSYACLVGTAKISVCQQIWADIFQVSSNWLSRRAECPNAVILPRDRPDNKSESVRVWLREMQTMHEHMPDTVGAGRDACEPDSCQPPWGPFKPRQTGILISFARKMDVYAEYAKDMQEQQEKMRMNPCARGTKELLNDGSGVTASDTTFFKIWKTEFRHIKLRKSTRFAKCDECVRLRGIIHSPALKHDKGQRDAAVQEFQNHLRDFKAERHYYHTKRREAVNNPAEVLSIILDGADQGSYGQFGHCLIALLASFFLSRFDADNFFFLSFFLSSFLISQVILILTKSQRLRALASNRNII